MSRIQRLNRKLYRKFHGSVRAFDGGDRIRLTGQLDSWDDIYLAGSMAVQKNKRIHVINEISLRGAPPIVMRCPSHTDSSLEGEHPDVLIIGGGISGCAIARELSKWDLSVLLVEKEADVALQASGRNDGEVHVGIDLAKGTLKQKYVLQGNRMFDTLCRDLNVPFRRIGQYACFTQWWLRVPVTLYAWWRRFHDGVKDVRIVGRKRLLEDHPTFSPEIRFAMFNSSAGIVSPYELTIAYMENAAENGVKVSLNTVVLSMRQHQGSVTEVHTNRGTVYPTVIVNAAGVFADTVAEMAGDRFYSIHPRRGTDAIQDVKSGTLMDTVVSVVTVNRDLLTSHSKGGGLLKTVHGNVLAGPDAVECREKEDFSTRPESIARIYEKQKRSIPAVSERDIITYFTGVRAPTYEEDFILEWGRRCKNLYHVAGIQSPGLTSAPAFAVDVAQELVDRLSLRREISLRESFDPTRHTTPLLRDLSPEERAEWIGKDPDYGVIVCRCEEISKGEILDALARPNCPQTVDAVKKRVRPGMGRCQGGFCSPHVISIIAERNGIAAHDVRKSSEESVLLYGPTKGGPTDAAES